jgi:SAM-dependent methyltransferase
MKASEYPRFFEFETTHWWFRGLHGALIDVLHGFNLDASARVLDAGCGTGGFMARLCAATPARVFGFDLAAEASPFWEKRGLATGFRASVNEIPLAADSMDAVFCINVFECDEVDPLAAYHELWRITRPGGHMVLGMPGHHWLGNKAHDAAIHTSRRFTRRELAALVATRPVVIERNTHAFPFFLPMIAAWRFAAAIRQKFADVEPRTDLSTLPVWLNELFYGLTQAERRLLRHMDFPFGSSLICVLRKDA